MTVEKIILLICACIWIISAIINFVCVYINHRRAEKQDNTYEFLNSIIEQRDEVIGYLWREIEYQKINTINELLKEIGNIPYGDMRVADFDWYIEICEKYGVENERKPKA